MIRLAWPEALKAWRIDAKTSAPPEQIKACDFCGKASDEAAILIASPTAMICDECVIVCVQTIRDRAVKAKAEAA